MLMKSRLSAVFAWALCGLICVMTLIALVNDFANRGAYDSFAAFANQATSDLIPIIFGIPAALIVFRQPHNTIGWLLMTPVAASVIGGPADSYVQWALTVQPGATLPLLLAAWYSNWSWLLFIFPLFLIVLLFPTGRPPSAHWNWASVVIVIWAIAFFLLATFQKVIQPLNGGQELPNPVGIFPSDLVQQLVGLWQVGLLLLTILCVSALFLRYRRGQATEREQIKWLVYASGLFAVVYVGGGVLGLGGAETFNGNVFGILLTLSAAGIPTAIAIAVLRYRLWDIDVIIRRTLQYTLVTGVLVLVYFGGVVLLQKIFSAILQESNASLTIVITTLVIAALFNPLRQRLQNFIDRRFYRQKYNTEQAITRFSNTARDEVDMEKLVSELLEVVEATMQPEGVNLWLKPSKGR
jgi:hypothetical protein